MNNNIEQPYGRLDLTFKIPEELGIAEQLKLAAIPTLKKLPWGWFILGGLALIIVISSCKEN